MSLYSIDGNDLETTYGIVVSAGKGFLDMPKRKEPTAHDWQGENGEEPFTDSNDINYEPRDITLDCSIYAATIAALETNLKAFRAVLLGSGLRTLVNPYTASPIEVYYKYFFSFNPITKVNANLVVLQMRIKLREPVPTLV